MDEEEEARGNGAHDENPGPSSFAADTAHVRDGPGEDAAKSTGKSSRREEDGDAEVGCGYKELSQNGKKEKANGVDPTLSILRSAQ